MIISLIGFMGCGKSSVGRRLSELLCCRFMDLDEEIVNTAGRSIPEIFATEGEAGFRQKELQALQKIVNEFPSHPEFQCHPEFLCHPERSEGSPHLILALGGGTVLTPQCAESVHKNTVCIYIRASVDTLLEHLADEVGKRPLLATTTNPRSRIVELLSQRSSTYEKTANIIIDIDGKSIEQICSEIKNRI